MSQLSVSLVNLTRKNVEFDWSDECEQSFEAIKQSLVKYPVLRFLTSRRIVICRQMQVILRYLLFWNNNRVMSSTL